MVFGHTVQGPGAVLQDDWKTLPPPVNLADYVNGFRRRLYEAVKQAKVQCFSWIELKHLSLVQGTKCWYCFLLLTCPYSVLQQVSDQNYLVATLEHRRKSQLFNVNLLNLYDVPGCGAEDVNSIVVAALSEGLVSGRVETGEECSSILQGCLKNSELLSNLDALLGHLAESNKEELKKLTLSFH